MCKGTFSVVTVKDISVQKRPQLNHVVKQYFINLLGGGRVVRRCHVSCVTGASN